MPESIYREAIDRVLTVHDVALVSKLGVEQCRQRLAAVLVTRQEVPRLAPAEREAGVVGSVFQEGFVVYRADSAGNPCRYVAEGQMSPADGATRILVRFTLPAVVRRLAYVVPIGLFVYEIALTLSYLLFPPSPLDHQRQYLMLAGLFITLGLLLAFWVGRALARDDDLFLLRFLKDALDAHELTQGTPNWQVGDDDLPRRPEPPPLTGTRWTGIGGRFMRPIAQRVLPVHEHVLATRLSPEECRERLAASLISYEDMYGQSWTQLTRTAKGSVTDGGFVAYQALHYANPGRYQAEGRVHAADDGARIVVRFSPSPGLWKIIWVAVVFVLIYEGMIFLSYFTPTYPPNLPRLLFALAGMLMIALLVVFIVGGRAVARGDDRFLLEFLKQTLDAQEVGHDTSSG